MKKIDYSQLSEIIRRVKEKDKEAFVELYELTYQRIYNLANSIVQDEYLAQDVVQEVYMIVIDSIGNLENDQLFMAWIHTITYRHSLNQAKKRKEIPLEMEALAESSVTLAGYDGILDQVMKTEMTRFIWENIKKLSNEQQAVIIMKYYNNMRIDEMAAALDCPEGTIKSRLYMAKKLLKKYLRRYTRCFFSQRPCIKSFYFPPMSRIGAI